MKDSKAKTFALIAAMLALRPASAATYTWNPNSEDPDNVFTNVVHFSPRPENGIGDIAPGDTVRVESWDLADWAVKVPEGEALAAAVAPTFDWKTGTTLSIDTRGASWTQPDASSAYPNNARLKITSVLVCSGSGRTAGAFKFDNALLTVAKRVGDAKETSATLSGGVLNLYDPNGTANADNIWVTGDSSASTFRFTVTNGASLRMAPSLFYAYCATNEWVFASGSNFLKKANIRVVDDASANDGYPRTSFLASGGNTFLDIESFDKGNYHGHKYEARDGATLVLSGTGGYTQPDTCFGWLFDNARLAIPNSSSFDWQNARIWATNSTFKTRKVTIQSGFAMLRNTDWTATDSIGTAWNNLGDTQLELDGGSIACTRMIIGNMIGVHTFRVKGGASVRTTDNVVEAFSVGRPGNSGGNYDGADSRVYLEGGTVAAPYVTVGGSGTALLDVSGGSLVCGNTMNFIYNSANGKTAKLIQTGGEITVSNGVVLVYKSTAANSAALMELDGGVMNVKGSISGGDGCSAKNSSKTSTATLRGNGGKLRALAASNAFVQKLNAAECGANGLTIESDYDITIPQSFSDAAGEAGELILAGSGKKKLSGAATTVARIVVADGTVELASGSTFASEVVVTNGASVVFGESPDALGITNLVFGSATSPHALALDASSPFEVGVPLSLVNVTVDIGGEFAAGNTYTLMSATAGVSSGSIAAWENAEFTVSDGSLSYRLTTAQDGGTTHFQVAVSGAAQTITVGEGETREYSDAISFGSHEAVVADVASNATLTISGDVACGSLMKRGLGRVVISGASKSIAAGVYCEGGVVSVSDASVLAGCGGVYVTDGTFEFAGAAAGDAQTLPCPLFGRASEASGIVDLKIESPLVVTNASVTAGCIVKRGVAALTFAPVPGGRMTLSSDNGFFDGNGWATGPNVVGDVSSEYWQRPTNCGYVGFNVAEGAVVLTGDATAHVDISHCTAIGLNVAGVRAAPSLLVDGLSASIANFSGTAGQINLGAGITQTTGSKGAFARIDVQNGANVSTRACRTQNGTSFASAVTARVDRATWTISNFLLPYGASSPVEKFFLLVQNGGKVYVGSYFQDYGGNAHVVELDGEGTVLAKNANLEGITWSWLGCDISVKNGAALYAAKMQIRDSNGQKDMRLAFDGGTWFSTPSTSQPYRFWKSTNVVVSVSGDGQTFPVASGQTVYVNTPIVGDGGFVKTGDGALDFAPAMSYGGAKVSDAQSTWVGTALEDPVTLAFGGELDVQGGKVTVSNGCCRTGGGYRAAEGALLDFDGNSLGNGVTFSGGGVFENASVGDCALAVSATDGEAPTFTDVTFGGSIRVSIGEVAGEVDSLAVATFSGGAPSLSSFSVAPIGGSYKATLFVDGNMVKARVWKSGGLLILR